MTRRAAVPPESVPSVLDQLLATEQELARNRANMEAECAAIVEEARLTAADLVRATDRELERELLESSRSDDIACADAVQTVEQEGRSALRRYDGISTDTLLRIAEDLATRVTGLAPSAREGEP